MFLAQIFSKSKKRENISILKIAKLKTTIDQKKIPFIVFFCILSVLCLLQVPAQASLIFAERDTNFDFFFLAIEISTIYDYIIQFMPNASPEKCWKQTWPLKEKLSIPNILQLVEICIVLPLSNAEVERVFSTFSKMMTR